VYSYADIIQAVEQAGPARPALDRSAFVQAAGRDDLAGLFAELRADADRTDPLPELPYRLFRTYVHSGDRSQYERRYFDRRRRLNSAAVVALIDGGEDNLLRLSDVLWRICDEHSWAVPAHHRFNTTLGPDLDQCIDLFAADTAAALAEIVTMLGDELEEPVRYRVRREIHRRVLSPFLDEPRSRWWETSRNNWAAVCAGSIGLAGLALEDDPLRLAALIERVQRTMLSFLSGFGADGGCPEGVDYWVYGYGYFTYYAEALRERTGLDLLAGTEAIASFPAAVDFGGGRCVSFSDGGDRAVPPTGLMSRLQQRLGTPLPHITRLSTLDDDRCYRWGHLTRTLAWADGETIGRPTPSGTSWLPELAWVVDRAATDAATMVFAAKGGHNDEPHNHLDLGGFIIAVNGEQLITDLGGGVYDADYFGSKRYNALHTSAAGHSVPRVADREQLPGAQYRAEVAEFTSQADSGRFAVDLSAAYAGIDFRRTFDWDRRGTVVLSDCFTKPGMSLEERFISRVPPRIEGRQVSWTGRNGGLLLRLDTDWEIQVDRIETADHWHRPDTVYRLRLLGTTAARRGFEFTAVAVASGADQC
jgi:hypothetical protein